MKKHTLLLLFFATLCFSCSKSEDIQHFDKFDTVLSLKAEKVEVPPILLYPRSVFLCNNYLVVFNEKVDTMFQVFHLPEMSYQYSFGVRGEGPYDFHLPAIKAVSYEKDGFTMVDATKLKHIRLDGTSFSVQTNFLEYKYNYFNGLTKLTDSLYCCDSDFEEDKEFMFLYPQGKVEIWGDYPENTARLKSVLNRNQAYNKIIVAKPDGTKFAAFYQSMRRYRVFDVKGNLEQDVVLDILPGECVPNTDPEHRYIHTIAAYATDKYIYTLNLDMTAEEIGKRKTTPSIQIFTWEGKPITQCVLDHFVSAFTVDEDQNKIYAVFAEDEKTIYTFNLPTL